MVTITAKVKEQAEDASPNDMFVMALLHARTTSHLQHWRTASRSDHQALQFFYDGIVPLIDDYVEAYQGAYSKVTPLDGYEFPTGTPLFYFEELAKYIDICRYKTGFPMESWLQNKVDEIRLLVSQTIYQLKDLK